MYEWHGKKYWGAAHGLAGIMHVLMNMELKPDEVEDVKNTLRYMIKNRFPSGNFRSSEGNDSDKLVHWCHGAPGVALTLIKAAEVFIVILVVRPVLLRIQVTIASFILIRWWAGSFRSILYACIGLARFNNYTKLSAL